MPSRIARAQIEAALRRVPGQELPALLAHLATLAHPAPGAVGAAAGTYLSMLQSAAASTALKICAGMLTQRCRHMRASDRLDAAAALDSELRDLAAQALALHAEHSKARLPGPADEDRLQQSPDAPMPSELGDGRFIQLAHEVILHRGCHAGELLRWQLRLARHEITRDELLAALRQQAVHAADAEAAWHADTTRSFHIMGTGQLVTLADWQARARELQTAPLACASAPAPQHFHIRAAPSVLVSAITSLYAGGQHIERFMDNIVGQSCFRSHAELIIVDAHSPDGERSVIERYLRHCPNIKYLRLPRRIGIYEAWNIALKAAAGDYLTSANVDDLRRHDSLAQQAAVLDNLPFVDVVYQDFFYTHDADLSFEQAAAFGYRSELPLVTPQSLMAMNPPHNAPMWRRRLHDELGLFDASYESAGDYEFWLRCVVAGKTFFKLNDPHIVYFQNPGGLSTRRGTKGHEESRQVRKRHGRQLVSDNLVMDYADFRARVLPSAADAESGSDTDRLGLVYQALQAAARSDSQVGPA